MRRRREQSLSNDDIALWTHVARTVRPFAGRQLPEALDIEDATARAALAHAAGQQPAAALPAKTLPIKTPPQKAARPALPPLAAIERRTLTALKRGRQPLEAVLDLHGLRQDEAHARLRHFLHREQANGARLVLVITGKGAAGASLSGDERGVLRRMVPHWLRMADLRHIVLGFEDAVLKHGGSGALYVRVRRLRDHAP